MYIRNFTAVVSILFIMILHGCSNGGSDSDASKNVALTLSCSSAVPGEYVTLTHDSFKVGVLVSVTWSDDNNYSVKATINPVADKLIKIAVPAYINMQNYLVDEGNVTVSVSGVSDTKPLNIRKPISIVYGDNGKPGEVLIEWFKQNKADYNNTLATIQTFGVDTADFAYRLSIEIERIDNILEEFDANNTFTIYYKDATTKTLTQDELREGDALLYTWALGLLAVNDDTALRASSSYSTRSLNELLDSETADKLVALQAVKNLRDAIPQIIDEAGGYSTLLVGGVTVVTGVAVLVGSIPAGTALVIGGLTAGTYAIITGVQSEGLDWMSSKIDNATLTVSNYEFGNELTDKASEAAVSFALSLGSVAIKVTGGIAELAYTGWNMFTAKIDSVCSTIEPTPSSGLVPLSTSLSDTEQFCSEIEIILIYKDYFEFTINIPGYSGPFNKELIAFTFALDDENATYPSVTAYTTTDFDPLKSDVLSLILNNNLTAPTSYNIDETWITDGGTMELFFTSQEILEDLDSIHKWPVGFSQTDGTLTLEDYGTVCGERLRGSFVMNMEGSKDTCVDLECKEVTTEIIRGTVSGTFDGFLKEFLVN